jgi:energy-coupling factor transport system permease protein
MDRFPFAAEGGCVTMFGQRADSRWRKLHPLTVVALLTAHAVTAFLWELHPLLLGGQLLFLLLWMGKEGFFSRMMPMLPLGIWFALLFMIVNALFSANGSTFLWKGPIVPYFGRLDLTMEELLYSLFGVIRLAIIVMVAAMYQRFVDHDRFLFLFAGVAPRSVLTAIMAFRLFPYLAKEFSRIKEIAAIRGIVPVVAGWRDKLAGYMFLLRPLLLSAFEGSWMMAETLYARGFGSGPRSTYNPDAMSGREKIGLLLSLLMILFALFARLLAFGRFHYYPVLVWNDPAGDLLLLCGLIVCWLVPLIWLGGGGKDQDDHL